MLSGGAPSEELPKNRLAVFTEKPSRDGAGSSGIGRGIGRDLQIVERLGFQRHRDIVLRQRRRVQRLLQFRIERRALGRPARRRRFWRPSPTHWRSRDPRFAGAASAGAAVSGGGELTRRSPFSVRSTLGKSEA